MHTRNDVQFANVKVAACLISFVRYNRTIVCATNIYDFFTVPVFSKEAVMFIKLSRPEWNKI